MKFKKFGEFTSPPEQIQENLMEPSIGPGVVEKQHNVDLLQNFVKNYQDLNENLQKAEKCIALFEQFTKEKDELIRKQEVENILTTHLLIVNENIQDIRSTLSGINKSDLQTIQNAVESIEEKTKTVLEYVSIEIPKVKKSVIKSELTLDNNLKTFAEEFKEYGETVGDLTAYKEGFEEEVSDLAEQVASNSDAINETKADLERQILSVYEDVRSVNTNLESLTEIHTSTITPIVERLNDFEKNLFLIDESFNSTIEKTKEEIRSVINEVNTLFINSKYEELDRKVERIEEIFAILEGKTLLNEETGVIDTVVTDVSTPEGRIKATADAVGKYLTDKSFQQPNPEKVSADFTAVTNKLKFLEQAIGRIAAAGPGGGEVNLRYLDDIDRATIADGLYLGYNATTKKFEFSNPALGGDIDNPYDRITAGDYSLIIDTSGAITTPTDASILNDASINLAIRDIADTQYDYSGVYLNKQTNIVYGGNDVTVRANNWLANDTSEYKDWNFGIDGKLTSPTGGKLGDVYNDAYGMAFQAPADGNHLGFQSPSTGGYVALASNSLLNYIAVDDSQIIVQADNARWSYSTDGTLTAPGDIVPDTDNLYGLGTSEKQWKHLYVSNTTVYLNNVPLSLKQKGDTNNYTITVGSGNDGNTQNDLATQDYVQAFQNIDGGSARAVYSADLINVDGGGA